MLKIRKVSFDEHEKIKTFYSNNNYRQQISRKDLFIIADDTKEIGRYIGIVRLVKEHNILVLRGMRVEPFFQRKGIGSKILNFAESQINNRECYCISYRYLKGFYEKVGFREIMIQEIPDFLKERYEKYTKEYNLDVIVMKRPVS